ncbi:MAG: DUF5667 domain-containing protein [Aeromicrobium sp.]
MPAEVAELIRTAELLCRSAIAEPATQFRTDLRDRLMTEAVDVLVPTPVTVHVDPASRALATTPTSPVRRRLVGLTAAAVAAVGSVGMITTSATAVPGDVLYPVKRGVESVQLALHRDESSRGVFQLNQARERLAEAWWLDTNDQDARVAGVLETFSDQATEGSTSLFAVYGDDSATAAIDTVNDFAAEATVTLAALSDDLPADAQAAVDLAASTVTSLAAQASTLCSACAPADLSALIAAIDEAISATPNASASSPGSAPAPVDESALDPATSGTYSSSTSVPSTGGSQPVTPPSSKAPALKDATDPLFGGLLGDANQEGLVPGILGGLLGEKKN